MLANADAAHNSGVVSHASARTDFSFLISDDHAVIQIVGVSVNVCIVGDRTSGMNDEFTPVIKQNIFVDSAIIFHRQVVTESDFNSVKNFYILAAKLEYV